MDPNQVYIPAPPYPGGPTPTFGPYFDGRHAYNTTNNPYVNQLLGNTNALQDMTFAFGAMRSQMAGDPNLAFANNMVNPAVNNAYSIYNAAQQDLQAAQHGGGGEAPPPGGEQAQGPDWGGGLKGAAGGALAGAAIGSFFPVIGTGIGAAVGAVVGGLVGLFS